jgi:hypothetical protein
MQKCIKQVGHKTRAMCKSNFRDSVLFAKREGTTNIIKSSLTFYIRELN